MAVQPSHKRKRLTIWVTEERAEELKTDAKDTGLRFPYYLERLLDRGWARRNV